MLGVVLNRAAGKPDETAYYYQPRHPRLASAATTDLGDDREAVEDEPEMIYLEEEGVS